MLKIKSLNAYELLQENKNCVLIDVRSEDEWQEENNIPKVEKIIFLSFNINNTYKNLKKFEQTLVKIPKNKTLLFICKSGVRSNLAALHAYKLGYKKSINIEDGFHGNINGIGWLKNKLPRQNYKNI
jgi:rhodanese-related sulfurtransferase